MGCTPLTPEQIAALAAYATAHGRFWRADLRFHWERGGGVDGPHGCILYALRNTHGPSWLARYRPANTAHK